VEPTRYFDHAATTPLDPAVLREMLPFLEGDFGNANSLHSFGRKAHEAVELARERVAEIIGAEDPSQIVFTSGATEGNNWVLGSFPDAVVSPFEHSSIRERATQLGLRTLQHVRENLSPQIEQASLLSVMAVNNETGTIWDAASLRRTAGRLHSDITQAVGKIPVDVSNLDFATMSAHKFYGPKGVGAAYVQFERLNPMLFGGEQEYGLRGGTLNVPGIVGMGVAAQIAMERREADYNHVLQLQEVVLETLAKVSDFQINGGANRSPFILSVSFLGIEGETLVLEADHSGYAISSGAACCSSKTEPSEVLRAMGLDDSWNRGTVRISFGRANTADSAASLAACLRYSAEKLRTMT
jgi:cysteine desulfurase